MMKTAIIVIIILVVIAGAAYILFTSPKEAINQETSQETAKDWVLENSPTYLFDGSDLALKESRALDSANCKNCYEFEYSFTSGQAGYGNREGEILAQVITPHTIVVTVEEGEVTKAITDEKFDEMTGQFLVPETETISLFYYNKTQDTDEEGNIMCSADSVLAIERAIPVSEADSTATSTAGLTAEKISMTIDLLLEGELTEEEMAQGFETEFPNSDFSLESAELTDGILTLTFTEAPGFTTGGSCRVGLLRAQIEKTALQFDEVEQVEIMPEELFQP